VLEEASLFLESVDEAKNKIYEVGLAFLCSTKSAKKIDHNSLS